MKEKFIDIELSFFDLFNDRIKQNIQNWYANNNVSERFGGKKIDELNIMEWSKLWGKEVGEIFFGRSILSLSRQVEIIQSVLTCMHKFIKRRNDVLEQLHRKWVEMESKKKRELLEEMAWNSVNTTKSELGYRLQMGMRNVGCSYRREDKWHRGCYMCGYYAGIAFGVKPTASQLVKQFENAIKKADRENIMNYDVIEFVSDGSFLNDEEVPINTRIEIFRQIATKTEIKRVLIETRPEFLTEDKITQLLDILRQDQKLEIGIGLETIDDFILNLSINKGYGREEFENAVKLIEKYKSRCSVLAYALVKPAYLTEKEALEDSIKTGKYIKEINNKYGVKVVIKYEPAVVAEGTLLEVLYEEKSEKGERKYTPSSYWTIVEIIARMEIEKASNLIRIGAREDMDMFKAIPATYYNIGMLSRFDFIIYDAVQKFNQNKNIVNLLLELEPAFEDDSFIEWKRKNGITHPIIMKLYRKYKKNIETLRTDSKYQRRKKFFDKLFSTLDQIEYGEQTQDFARKIGEGDIDENDERSIKKLISFIIENNLENVSVKIDNIDLLQHGLKLLRMELTIYERQLSESYSIWIGIPTARRVKLDEVEYSNA